MDKYSFLSCFLGVFLLSCNCFAEESWASYNLENLSIRSLGTFDGHLYAGTDSPNVGAIFAFDGKKWSTSFHQSYWMMISSITEHQNELYFSYVNGYPYGGIMLLNGSNWTWVYSQARIGVSESAMSARIYSFNGKLYSGKSSALTTDDFSDASIIVYNGTDWSHSLESNGRVLDFKAYNGKLYAGFISSHYCGYGNYSNIIFLNGSSWLPSHVGCEEIYSLESYDGKLYAGTNGSILRFDGSTWSTAYTLNNTIVALKTFDGKLYAGLLSGGVLSYDGTVWSNIYYNRGAINALEEYDGKLYIGREADSYDGYGGLLVMTPTVKQLDALRMAINNSIEQAKSKGYSSGLVAFSGLPSCIGGICSYHALTQDIDALYSQVNAYEPEDATCLSCSINKATELLTGFSGKKYMIIASDGLPQSCLPDGSQCNGSDIADIEETAMAQAREKAIQANASGIKIYTIAIGTLGGTGLSDIAALGGGKTYTALCQSTLNSAYHEIIGNYAQDNVIFVNDISGSMDDAFDINCSEETTTTTSTTTTSSTTSTTTTSTTSTTSPGCLMPGNAPPCGSVDLSEVVSGINKWTTGTMTLAEVIDLINSWADPISHVPN